MTKRKNGKGSISRTKSGRYRGAIYVTFSNGERKRISNTFDTRKEVEMWFKKVTNQDVKFFSPTTVNEYWEHYIDIKKGQFRESTIAGAIHFYNKHVKDTTLGKTKFYDLTPTVINKYFIGLSSHGYSTATLSRWHKNFKSILNLAVYEGYLEENPMNSPFAIKRVKGRPVRPIHTFSKDEVHRLLLDSNLKKLPYIYQAYILLAFMTGGRPQEILALTKQDVTETSITFSKSLGHRGKLQDCMKTAQSARTVGINPVYGKRICEIEKALPERLFKSTKSANGYISMDNLNVRFKKYVTSVLGTSNGHRLYDTRHTFATLLIVNEHADVKTVSKLMGHTNIETTLKYYTHVSANTQHLWLHV